MVEGVEFTNRNERPEGRERKTFIGEDIIFLPPYGKDLSFGPDQFYRDFAAPLPVDYFSRYQGQLDTYFAAMFSMRSALQQAGLVSAAVKAHEEANVVTLALGNGNPNTTLHFPERLPLGRLFILGSMINNEELERLLPLLFPDQQVPDGVELGSNGMTISLPITRFAKVTTPEIYLASLRNNRTELDEKLGFNWQPEIDAQLGELIIGETPKLIMPRDVHGYIVMGGDDDGGSAHEQSPFIDPNFGLATGGMELRTEIRHGRDSTIPVSRVMVQFFHI